MPLASFQEIVFSFLRGFGDLVFPSGDCFFDRDLKIMDLTVFNYYM